MEKRIFDLTQPPENTGDTSFEEMFNLNDIQRLQDDFSAATGVASIITQIDGTPITKPSNFSRFCGDIIRNTEKGCANCHKSDTIIGELHLEGPTIQPCMSGGLWDAGAGIAVGGVHVANWLIGQVRDETQTEEKIRTYAKQIGADEEKAVAAFLEVPSMSLTQFEKVANALFTLSNTLSNIAYQNVQQSRFIAERKYAEKQLNFYASHDALTGLVNRREFEIRAEQLLSTTRQCNDEHALCFMDLDQFKIVNDTCGHVAGDELLRQLSTTLQEIVRDRDTLARLGGDEFGILMEHCSLDDAHRVATTIQKAIQNYQFVWGGHGFKVGVSLGLVSLTKTTTNLMELLRDADAACYTAKDKGRNRIHVYHVEDSEIAQRHGEMQWVTRIQHALDEDKFCLYAQSIVPLNNSNDKHYELLIRLLDDKGEIIPPEAFLPAAERYSLMTQIDCWVIENTFRLLAENPLFQSQINFISINLSGQSLAEQNVLDLIIKQLDETDIEGKNICFEITETAAISNLGIAMKFISTLKEMGCQFALDDFGSGLSSFAYLKNLPVDYLKIDGMFVKDIVDDPIDHAMVKSINEIGQVMGMKTIAEFVENDEIKGMLREIGVNYAQGYGIHKPQPFDELLEQFDNVSEIKNLKVNKTES